MLYILLENVGSRRKWVQKKCRWMFFPPMWSKIWAIWPKNLRNLAEKLPEFGNPNLVHALCYQFNQYLLLCLRNKFSRKKYLWKKHYFKKNIREFFQESGKSQGEIREKKLAEPVDTMYSDTSLIHRLSCVSQLHL